MRRILFCSLAFLALRFGSGCGASAPAPAPPPLTAAQEELEATRIFEVARKLEKEGQTQAAAAAYRRIVRAFPKTPPAKQARTRIQAIPRR